MKPAAKIGVVVGGYAAALLAAALAVALSMALTDDADRRGSSGMVAFGDALLFLAVFGLAAVVPTGAGLVFLRPYRVFWRALSGVAVPVAASGALAAVVYVAQRGAGPGSVLHAWSALAVLRLLAAPVCAGALFLSGAIAPSRGPRALLLGGMVVEAGAFVVFLVGLFASGA